MHKHSADTSGSHCGACRKIGTAVTDTRVDVNTGNAPRLFARPTRNMGITQHRKTNVFNIHAEHIDEMR